MKNKSASSAINVLLLAAFCLLLPLNALPVQGAEEVVIVVNKSNGVAKLSSDDVRRIFMCDKTVWPNGKHITVLMLVPGQAARATIVRDVYKMNEADYARYFLQAAFTGRISSPPKEMPSAVQMKQVLAQNPGGIGYLNKSDVDDSVKVVFELP